MTAHCIICRAPIAQGEGYAREFVPCRFASGGRQLLAVHMHIRCQMDNTQPTAEAETLTGESTNTTATAEQQEGPEHSISAPALPKICPYDRWRDEKPERQCYDHWRGERVRY